MISKPETQKNTANENINGNNSKLPLTDKNAPIGANAKPTPKIK